MKKEKTSRASFRAWLKRLGVIFIFIFLGYQAWIFLHVLWWRSYNPATTSFMEDRIAAILEKKPKFKVKHKWVPYNHISIHLKRALVASEDAKFLDHEGFDWEGIQDAWEKNIKKGRIVAGGSTISQQLAKNLFLTSKRTPWRKLEEAAITVMLETMMNKRRIFEIYLNVIEWGEGVFGAEAAARRYYKTSADRISPDQAAKLASMVPNPRYYEKNFKSRKLARKAAIIRRRMVYADVP